MNGTQKGRGHDEWETGTCRLNSCRSAKKQAEYLLPLLGTAVVTQKLLVGRRPFQLSIVNGQWLIVNGSWERERPFLGWVVWGNGRVNCQSSIVNRKWGTVPSQGITERDFTGQKENMELGLMYYNARYYVPGIGRFASADTIVPNPTNPQAFNRYSYTLNSPLKYTDPTGHYFFEKSPSDFAPPLISRKKLGELEDGKYDLTNWLAEEMVSNATGADMLEIQKLRSGNIFQTIAGALPFLSLNTNDGRWNFKEQTKVLLGEMVVLCGTKECGWFDYSTPGNIHYGFMAAAAGIKEEASQVAAGTLEALDGNWHGLTYWNEHPEDWAAVELGYLLYDAFGVDMTVLQLQIGLDIYWDQLQQPDSRLLKPADGIFPPETPYSLGTFDYEEE